MNHCFFLNKTHIFIVLVLAIMSIDIVKSQTLTPCHDCDTIPSRYYKYYYTQWYDEVPMYGVTDSCWTEKYVLDAIDQTFAVWQFANQPMLIKGLVALVDPYAQHKFFLDTFKLPEYLHLYQLTMKDSSWNGNPTPWAMSIDLQLLDSVRWDTIKPHWMPIEQGGVHPITQYIYAYECYFNNPVWVDSDFYINGTINNDRPVYDSINNDYHISLYYTIPTFYASFERRLVPQKGTWDEDCPNTSGNQEPLWTHTKGHVAIYYDVVGWHCPWPNNYYGMFLPIVDQLNIELDVDTNIHGQVFGSGRYPIGWYDTIRAVAYPGYRFAHWNDGNTDNPRIVHPDGDTSFTAHFVDADYLMLQVLSDNEEWGVVTGDGYYPENQTVTIEAHPTSKHLFTHWNDGNTDNPRTVLVTQDTVFTAYFSEPTYILSVNSADENLGMVDGGGVYHLGDTAVITATPLGYTLFDMWSDGNWDNPRSVVVTNDSSFTAIFIDLNKIDKPQAVDFSLAPNPASGSITISVTGSGLYRADIYDNKGYRVKMTETDKPSTEIDISMLPDGLYYLRLSKDGVYGVKTFVKK